MKQKTKQSKALKKLNNWIFLKTKKKSMKEISKLIGISQQTLWHIRSGNRKPTLKQAIKLKKEIGINPAGWQ